MGDRRGSGGGASGDRRGSGTDIDVDAASGERIDEAAAANNTVDLGDVLRRGHPGHLTEEESAALEAFKKQVTEEELQIVKYEVESDDMVLCRYLRARKFNVDLAVTMIRESVAKRQQEKPWEHVAAGPDECLDCPEAAFCKFYPNFFYGFDKWGRPVLYDQVGRMDIRFVQCVTDIPHMIRYHWFTMLKLLSERFQQASQRGYPELRFGLVSVLDLQGLSSSSLARDVTTYIREIAAIDQLCFPEMLGRMFIVNAPRVFAAVWKIIKGWLDPKTAAKIEIHSTPDRWKPRLLQCIPAEEIPQEYGGTAPPLSSIFEDDHIEGITLNKGQSLEKRIPVTAGQRLKAYLYTTGEDLEWSVSRVEQDNAEVLEAPPEKIVLGKEVSRRKLCKEFVAPEGVKAYVLRYRNAATGLMGASRQFVIINVVEPSP